MTPAPSKTSNRAARITVVEQLTHDQPGDKPLHEETRLSLFGREDEQPFRRWATVGQDWQRIETGWVKGDCMVRLENTRPVYSKVPSPEEKVSDSERILQIAYLPPSPNPKLRTMHDEKLVPVEPVILFLVHPGDSIRFTPADLSVLRVRCMRGETKCTLVALAR